MKRGSVSSVAAEIATLRQLPAPALRERWATVFGRPAPGRVSRAVLMRAIAWKLQAREYGGLKRATLRRLEAIAAPKTQGPKAGREPVRLHPGTRLLRDWQGQTHTVEVSAEGFLWQGERYRSLSVIAQRITGTQWSGPRFFGLRSSDASKST